VPKECGWGGVPVRYWFDTVFGIGSELVRYRYGTGTVGLGNR